jgi:hypothetical protein
MASPTPDPASQPGTPVPAYRTSRRDRRMFALVAAGTLLLTVVQVLIGATSAHA